MFATIQRLALVTSVLVAGMQTPNALGGTLFKVHVTGSVEDWDGGLGAQFSVGDQLSLDYSFDSAAVDKLPNDSLKGDYDILSFEGSLGSYNFKAGYAHASTFPQSNAFGDQFFVYGENFLIGADVASAHLVGGFVGFRDFDAAFLTGDNLPLTAPDLSIMEYIAFALAFDTPSGDRILVRANLDSVTIQEIGNSNVPEPNSFLVAVGLFGTIALVRCRHLATNRSVPSTALGIDR